MACWYCDASAEVRDLECNAATVVTESTSATTAAAAATSQPAERAVRRAGPTLGERRRRGCRAGNLLESAEGRGIQGRAEKRKAEKAELIERTDGRSALVCGTAGRAAKAARSTESRNASDGAAIGAGRA